MRGICLVVFLVVMFCGGSSAIKCYNCGWIVKCDAVDLVPDECNSVAAKNDPLSTSPDSIEQSSTYDACHTERKYGKDIKKGCYKTAYMHQLDYRMGCQPKKNEYGTEICFCGTDGCNGSPRPGPDGPNSESVSVRPSTVWIFALTSCLYFSYV